MIAANFIVIVAAVAFFTGWLIAVVGLGIHGADDDRPIPWLAAAFVLFVLGMAAILWAIDNDNSSHRADCEAHGGSWVQTGSQPILVGKVIVNTPIYGCRLP